MKYIYIFLLSIANNAPQICISMHTHTVSSQGPALTRLYYKYFIFQLWQQSSLISRSAPLEYTDGWIFIPSHLCANEWAQKSHLTEMELLTNLYPFPSCKNIFCFNIVHGQEYDCSLITYQLLFGDENHSNTLQNCLNILMNCS